MYVESVSMTDFRCFEKAETTFVYPGMPGLPEGALPNVTLLIGINGAGKTSLLRGVALGLLTDGIHSLGYIPYSLIRVNPKRAIQQSQLRCRAIANTDEERRKLFDMKVDRNDWITPRNMNPVKLLANPHSFSNRFEGPVQFSLELISEESTSSVVFSPGVGDEDFHAEASSNYFLLGYGASRRSEYVENLDSQRSRRRHPRFQRVAGLFEEFITLYPLAAWYPLLKSKPRAKEVRELLNSLLPGRMQFRGKCEGGEGLFDNDGVTLPFGALSDGFRSYIGLLADMLYNMHAVSPKGKLAALAGVVIIDDIDVHLHPGWQREIVPKLASTFPKLQFIITTHSPLVVGTVHATNIRVIEDNQIREFTEQTDGRSADQILMSSYFGLDSPRSPAAEKKLKKIAKRVADTHDPKAAVEFLKELTGQT